MPVDEWAVLAARYAYVAAGEGGATTDGRVTLTLSLLFGAAQVAAGAVVAWRLLPRGPWRSNGSALLFAVCLWFVCSGLTELIVSGMELSRAAGNGPSTEVFAVWRGRADMVLLVMTTALALALLARPLLVRLLAYAIGPRGRR